MYYPQLLSITAGFIMTDCCNCNEFEKAVDYDDIRYYRVEDDRFNAVKKQGWYIGHGIMTALLLVWNHSDIAHGVRRN